MNLETLDNQMSTQCCLETKRYLQTQRRPSSLAGVQLGEHTVHGQSADGQIILPLHEGLMGV